jgi:retinol dehydrogenase-12
MAYTSISMRNRYCVSKLLEVLFTLELVHRLKPNDSSDPPVVIDLVNPGLCSSTILRTGTAVENVLFSILCFFLARTTEVGSRTYVHAASAGQGSHGLFMSDGENQEVEPWILTEEGKRAQVKVFEQTMKILEKRSPGIGKAIGV